MDKQQQDILKEIIQNKNKNCLNLQKQILKYIPKEKQQEFMPLFMAYYHAVGTLNLIYSHLLINELHKNIKEHS